MRSRKSSISTYLRQVLMKSAWSGGRRLVRATLGAVRGGSLSRGVLEDGRQLPVQNELRQALGQGGDELALFLQEGPLVAVGHGVLVGPAARALGLARAPA